ncbi:sulfotransferase domain-containing protein [Oceanimonas smirnovii]|uniref:sulfotransferase domain-containing protein n=1 Tax=Oceanimonas smirnovii TaxID=264574 RepID=UPI00036E9902|nr:sulfotransferase domain-containing protein [Oceanimonas smirnovii]
MKKIAIFSVPRSGSTWLGEIFNSSTNTKYCFQPLFSYSLKSYLSEDSTAEEIDEFYKKLVDSDDEFICQTQKRIDGILPQFSKKSELSAIVFKEVRYINIIENLLNSDKEIKIIGLVRNPLSVMASWFKAPKEFNPEWSIEDQWFSAELKNQGRKEEFFGFERWLAAAKLFTKLQDKHPEQFKLVKYSELTSNTDDTVKDLFDFVELDYEKKVLDFISESKIKQVYDTYSVYRKNQDDDKWKHVVSDSIYNSIVASLKENNLQHFL